MSDRFDDVVGPGRGGGRQRLGDSPLSAAREVVRLLNSDELEWVIPATDTIRKVIADHGLTISEYLSLEREDPADVWNFNGFLVVLAANGVNRPFAAVRLHDDRRRDDTAYAELLVFDRP